MDNGPEFVAQLRNDRCRFNVLEVAVPTNAREISRWAFSN